MKRTPDQTFCIRTERDLDQLVQAASFIVPDARNPMTVTISEQKEARRDKQNRLAFKWYQEMADQTGHGKEYERNYCKLKFGVPILREDPEANELFGSILDQLPYEMQLDAMEYLEVTRLFTVRQFAQYLTDIDMTASVRGIHLTHPDDLYWDALMRQCDERDRS